MAGGWRVLGTRLVGVLIGLAALIAMGYAIGNVHTKFVVNLSLVQGLKETDPLVSGLETESPGFCNATGLSDKVINGLNVGGVPSKVDPCYYLHRARLFCIAGDAEGAARALERATGCLRPDLLHMISGDVAYALGDWAGARYEWSLSPDNVPVLLNRAFRLLDVEEDALAKELLQVLEIRNDLLPHEALQVYDGLGRIARIRRDPEQIERAYTKALRYAPDRADYLVWIGIAQREQGDLSESYASLELAVQMWDPELCEGATWAQGQFALSQEAMGDTGGALDSMRAALGLAEGNADCSEPRAQWLRYHVQRLEDLGQE